MFGYSTINHKMTNIVMFVAHLTYKARQYLEWHYISCISMSVFKPIQWVWLTSITCRYVQYLWLRVMSDKKYLVPTSMGYTGCKSIFI